MKFNPFASHNSKIICTISNQPFDQVKLTVNEFCY